MGFDVQWGLEFVDPSEVLRLECVLVLLVLQFGLRGLFNTNKNETDYKRTIFSFYFCNVIFKAGRVRRGMLGRLKFKLMWN